ncbi:MAG: sigma factor-like helix-turn-helix DNA-binding protein, partial [bacterium]
FVLREVFDMPYDEIAEAVGKTPAAVRQIVRRARNHVAARRPRMEVTRTEQHEVVERFLAALASGDMQGLMDVLAPDVVMIADGGGLAPAFRRPVEGGEKVASLLFGLKRVSPDAVVGSMWINGAPSLRVERNGALDTAISLTIAHGRITRIYAIRNPHKLGRLEEVTELQR